MNNAKSRILAFLPVMKELENAGFNPVEMMFSGSIQLEKTEEIYKAIYRAKKKYPKWYKVMSQYVAGIT